MDRVQEAVEDFVEEYVWDDSEGHGLGGKQYGATIAQCWGTACSVASTVGGYSWAIGTTALVLLLPVQVAVDSELAMQAQEQQMAAQGGPPAKS